MIYLCSHHQQHNLEQKQQKDQCVFFPSGEIWMKIVLVCFECEAMVEVRCVCA